MVDHYTHQNRTIDLTKLSVVDIRLNGQPDTIYRHSPQQHPIEFICFIGVIISLWTGFSVISLYAYGKGFFMRKNKNSKHEKNSSINSRNSHVHPCDDASAPSDASYISRNKSAPSLRKFISAT